MTDYKNIFGKPVKFLSTDPTDAGAEGQIWYNSTSDTFKSVVPLEAWSSGSPLITGRQYLAGMGTQTSALVAGGSVAPKTQTEEYNGSGWSNGGNLNTARSDFTGCGLQTAGLGVGGYTSPGVSNATEEYDGSSWTTTGNLNTSRYNQATFGIQTAAVAAGGGGATPVVGTRLTSTEHYNGSVWTSVPGTMNTARRVVNAFGIQTAAVAIAGNGPAGNTNVVEEYNGTTWTSVTNYPQTTSGTGCAGIESNGLSFGGGSPVITTTVGYDGTSWTAKPSMATARGFFGPANAGPSSATLAAGGYNGTTAVGITEEYNKSGTVITPAAWSSGGNLPVGKQGFGGAGTRSASLIFGGYIGGPGVTGYVATTEEYNGASWSSGGALPTSRSNPIGFGTQTAGVAFGGIDNVPVFLSSGDHYDGSTWTATPNNYPSNVTNASSCGTQTAGLAANGYDGTAYLNNSNEYDGTSWTAGGTVPVSWSGRGTGGIQTSAIIFGGTDGGSPFPASGQSQSDEYNGSTWTTVASLPSGRIYPSGAGNTSADNVRAMGGRLASPAGTPTAEHNIYDGTVWSTQPSITTARQQAGITVYSSTPEAMITGGNDPGGSFLTATEEFTGETTALNLKTLTTS